MWMRILGQFQTSLIFYKKISSEKRKHKKYKNAKKQTKTKKHLRGRKSLVCVFVLFVRSKSFRKKIKKFEIALIASFTLLLKSAPKRFLSVCSVVSLSNLNICTNLGIIEMRKCYK